MLCLGDTWNARYCCSYEFEQHDQFFLGSDCPQANHQLGWTLLFQRVNLTLRTFPEFQPSSFNCFVNNRHVKSCFGTRMSAKSRRSNWSLPMKISTNLRSSLSASIPASIQLLWWDVGWVPFFAKRLGINMWKKDLTAKAIIKNEARIHIQPVRMKVTDFSQSESAPIGQWPQWAAYYMYWLSLLDKARLLLALQRLFLVLSSAWCQLFSHLPPGSIEVAQKISTGARGAASHGADTV